jgi:hypothetical protein
VNISSRSNVTRPSWVSLAAFNFLAVAWTQILGWLTLGLFRASGYLPLDNASVGKMSAKATLLPQDENGLGSSSW